MCLKNIIGISVTMRALEPGKRFKHTFRILQRWRRLQRFPKHIGPTLHVGPNNYKKSALAGKESDPVEDENAIMSGAVPSKCAQSGMRKKFQVTKTTRIYHYGNH